MAPGADINQCADALFHTCLETKTFFGGQIILQFAMM
jgi:hypothetical protein